MMPHLMRHDVGIGEIPSRAQACCAFPRRRTYRGRSWSRAGNRTAPSRFAPSRSPRRYGREKRTSGARRKGILCCCGKTCAQTSSLVFRTRATKVFISSGAPGGGTRRLRGAGWLTTWPERSPVRISAPPIRMAGLMPSAQPATVSSAMAPKPRPPPLGMPKPPPPTRAALAAAVLDVVRFVNIVEAHISLRGAGPTVFNTRPQEFP